MAKKVLVVDDEPDILEMLGIRLESNGYTVITAFNKEGCFKKATEENPDLILLDVLLPGIGGLEICKLLKKDAKMKDIPVIIITALIGESAVEAGLESGAVCVISKPFDPADLLEKIADVLKSDHEIV
ncbi:MAG: response regulator [Candidatus Omnitrophica bacterium]|nr:response regulator [Candidatus Omnitrophota bacterium]